MIIAWYFSRMSIAWKSRKIRNCSILKEKKETWQVGLVDTRLNPGPEFVFFLCYRAVLCDVVANSYVRGHYEENVNLNGNLLYA
jgi:hypothetical protein